MRITKLLSKIVLGSFLTTTALAQEPMLWSDCVSKALEHHPQLQSAKQDIEVAGADQSIAKSDALPQVNATATSRWNDASHEKPHNTASYGVSGKWLLFDGLKTPNQIKAASKDLEEKRFAFNVASSDLLLTLRTAFVEVMEAQEFVGLTQDIANRRQQNVDLVRLRYEGGREHSGALSTAQADLAQAQFEVAQATRNLDLTKRQLLIAMGIKDVEPISVSGHFQLSANYDDKPDVNAMVDQIPFVRELIAAKESAGFLDRAAKGNFFPEVSALAGADRTGRDMDTFNNNDSYVGLSVTLPLFEGGRNVAQAKRSHALFLRAKAQEQNGRNEVILSLEENWKELQDAKEFVAVKEKFLQAADERAKIAKAQYGTGLIGFDDWVIIENNLVAAQKAKITALANVLIAEANWVHAIGGTLNDTTF